MLRAALGSRCAAIAVVDGCKLCNYICTCPLAMVMTLVRMILSQINLAFGTTKAVPRHCIISAWKSGGNRKIGCDTNCLASTCKCYCPGFMSHYVHGSDLIKNIIVAGSSGFCLVRPSGQVIQNKFSIELPYLFALFNSVHTPCWKTCQNCRIY